MKQMQQIQLLMQKLLHFDFSWAQWLWHHIYFEMEKENLLMPEVSQLLVNFSTKIQRKILKMFLKF